MLKKKEKLEQMRELGRGGLSKGLHFLRSAAANASLENGETTMSSATSEDGSETQTTNRMTYEELLALSMKLTRQNKLMKAQYQKNQIKLAAASVNDADVQTLRGFLEHEVGLDVAACVKANSTSGSSIDVEALKEKYHILSELKQKETQPEIKPVASVNLLDLSPVVTKKKYEEIDLQENADQVDEAMEQVERMREQLKQGAEHTKELERKLVERDKQQEAARRVLEEEKMRLEEKEQQWREKWEEQSRLVDELTKKQELEKEAEESEEQKKEMEESEEHEEELTRLAKVKQELEMRIGELSAQLNAEIKQREAEQQKAADSLAKVELEKAELAERLQQAEAAASAASASYSEVESEIKETMQTTLETRQGELEAARADNNLLHEQVQTLQETLSGIDASRNEGKEEMATALEARQSELEAVKKENAKLQEQIQVLKEEVACIGASKDEGKEEIAAALEARQSELEAVKKENANLQKQIEALHQTASVLPSEAPKGDAEDVMSSLRAEVDRLQDMLEAKESYSESLQRELAALKEQAPKLQNEVSQKDSNNTADAALMQELERVKLESAEHIHEIQALQKKLHTAEEHLAKVNSEDEATQSLVEALKDDTSRLADQVAQLEQKQAALEKEISELTNANRELEEEGNKAREAKTTMEKQLEEERTYWTSKLENLITDSDAAKRKTETLESELRKKEKQVTKMTASQTSMTSELMELHKQMRSMREDLSMAAEGMEAHATKAEANERRYIQSEKEAAELKKQLDEMREKHRENFEMLRQEKKAELERVHTERRTLVTEKKELLREKDELQDRCKALANDLMIARKHEEELEASLSAKTSQAGNLSADLAETKKSLSDRMALATRLQTENMGMAGKLAEQVALIEGALRDAANSKAAQREMESQMQVAKADVQRMKQSEVKAQRDLENVKREMVEKEASFQLEREEAKERLQAAVKNEEQRFKRKLERLEADSRHKSKLALQAVLEKEKEIARLSARLHELEEDVRSGGADNRKILEFAQLQAKREAEARKQTAQMQALSEQLEEAHRELQELREDKQRHAEELTVMLQNQRRDGVNMEYLKNVVVQYMSFRPGSSQQERLVPVLSTLLQFTTADVKEIKHAARRGSSWTSWGSSDASLDYKPIVVGAGHRHSMASSSSSTTIQSNGERRSPMARMASASVPRVSPPLPQPSRASSFFLPNGSHDEPADPCAESADF